MIPLTIVAMNFRAPLQIFYAQTRCQKGCGSIRSRLPEVTCSAFGKFPQKKKKDLESQLTNS